MSDICITVDRNIFITSESGTRSLILPVSLVEPLLAISIQHFV